MQSRLIELDADHRQGLGRLFRAFPFMSTVVRGVIDGRFGRAWADDVESPRVGWVQLDFNFVAGDPANPAAVQIATQMQHAIVPDEMWEPALQHAWGMNPRTHQRISFRGSRFDGRRLSAIVAALPAGFDLQRIDRTNAAGVAELGPFLVGNFATIEDFEQRGAGFAIAHASRFVSAASSFCVAGNDLEIETQTHADFRRRGLATVAAARLILDCLARGVTPHWDAHNHPSAELARKLGFCDELAYHVYHKD